MRCRTWSRNSPGLSRRKARSAPGQPDPDRRNGIERRGGYRHRHREPGALYDELVTLPCYEWHHCVVVPPKHPLLLEKRLTLKKLAQYPIITYDFAFTGRNKINQAFHEAGIEPNIALTAIDADVIKTYVELGLGVGIVAQMAFIPDRDRHLRMIDAGHLIQPSTTRIAIRKNQYLRGFGYHFIELFAPHLTRDVVSKALHLTA